MHRHRQERKEAEQTLSTEQGLLAALDEIELLREEVEFLRELVKSQNLELRYKEQQEQQNLQELKYTNHELSTVLKSPLLLRQANEEARQTAEVLRRFAKEARQTAEVLRRSAKEARQAKEKAARQVEWEQQKILEEIQQTVQLYQLEIEQVQEDQNQ